MNKFIIKNGKVYTKQEDGSERFRFEDVKLVGIERNLHTKKIFWKIQFKYGGEIVEECVPRSTLQTKKNILILQDIGLGVTEENARDMIEYLKLQEVDTEIQVSHSSIGYDSETNTFRLFNSFPSKSIYDGKLDIKPKGSYEQWLNVYRKEVKDRLELQLAIVISASSAIVGMIGREIGLENPVVHIYGDSSTGKTTAVQLGLSVWGNPNLKSSGLVQNYNETINALMHNLRDNNGVAICFDEISMSTAEDFTSFIYSTSNGKEKGRLSNEIGKGYIKLEQATWNTVIFSTGEYNILEKAKENDGLKVRVYDIGGVKWTKNAENSDKIKRVIFENYGHAGERFVDKLIKYNKESLQETYNLTYEKLVKMFEKQKASDELTNRRIKYYSLIVMTTKLLNRHLSLGIEIGGILDMLIQLEIKSISERNVGVQAYKKFLEVIAKNRRKFPIIEGKRYRRENIKDDVWGYVLKKDTQVEIFPHEFKKQCNQLGFQSHTVILNKWKQMGILDYESDRLHRQRLVGQVYVINVDKAFIETLVESNEEAEEDIRVIV